MSLTIAEVFGVGASLDGDNLIIPTSNLSVIDGVTADYSKGAEAVFAVLDHLATSTEEPLSSGNIQSSVSTTLLNDTQLTKTYIFTLTVGDIELKQLDVVQ